MTQMGSIGHVAGLHGRTEGGETGQPDQVISRQGAVDDGVGDGLFLGDGRHEVGELVEWGAEQQLVSAPVAAPGITVLGAGVLVADGVDMEDR